MNTMNEIIKQAATVCNIGVKEVLSKSRRQDLVYCRAAIAKVARAQGMIPQRIAKALNRDRTTILHALNIAEEPHVQGIIRELRERLKRQELEQIAAGAIFGFTKPDIFRFTQPTIFLAE